MKVTLEQVRDNLAKLTIEVSKEEFAIALDKAFEKVVKDIKVDYAGFNIPDEFVVGYGLDYDQKYRNLPYIGMVKFD